jgi:Uncharacterized protein conserved in bacteria (DUF2252)
VTVKTEAAAVGRSGPRASGRGPARAAAVEQLSRADRVARGKDARAVAPLESHGEFAPGGSRDPVGLLLGQAKSRVPELVPARHGRMLVSPFTFYRGAALPMAADLASTPAPVTASRWPPISAARAGSTRRSPTSPKPTPTRTNAITPRSRPPSKMAKPKPPPKSRRHPHPLTRARVDLGIRTTGPFRPYARQQEFSS